MSSITTYIVTALIGFDHANRQFDRIQVFNKTTNKTTVLTRNEVIKRMKSRQHFFYTEWIPDNPPEIPEGRVLGPPLTLRYLEGKEYIKTFFDDEATDSILPDPTRGLMWHHLREYPILEDV
ncbi:MAG: hypothetical protein LBT09_11250 [Planctomycetaceae bacterium]|jgi:hypothetical protein|nr:hypothetical protein [Planctomycetaceae bacterium]